MNDLLVAKFKYFRCDKTAMHFFKSYHWKRSQQVSFDDISSKSKHNLSGVPQGSLLGQLLFILSTENTQKIVFRNEIQLLADDTQLIHYFKPNLH